MGGMNLKRRLVLLGVFLGSLVFMAPMSAIAAQGTSTAILTWNAGAQLLTADANTVGWTKATIRITGSLYREDSYIWSSSNTCAGSTYCQINAHMTPCPFPGRWYMYAHGSSSKGGSDDHERSVVVAY